ncbi:hypothetical protein EUX98_g7314 [Antrodiella citrinella]|uniref:Protein kinase domain-containing protein n=1 Tax=Antrodiella citrinella TaxID=2447956 RepID=A0A4S4MU66_9APHY|nr:hypothetical protein EUX98_g7314 [Antrodiella citrinella]
MSDSIDSDAIALSETSKTEILTYIDDVIPLNQNDPTVSEQIPDEFEQNTLDVLWDLLDPKHGPAKGVKNNRILLPKVLRRLTMKLVLRHNKLPRAFYLKGVNSTEKENRGAGGFADVFIGEWKGKAVALKRLRVESKSTQVEEALQKQFCRESILWMHLDHEHVLPFYGVSDDAFSLSICMVSPWMHNGNIRHYINDVLRETYHVGGQELVHIVQLHQVTLGLIYLLGEDIIHGDLHGGNILIDARGSVRLTDLGTGSYIDRTPHPYAFQYRAPELHDPEEFDLNDDGPTVESDIFAFACVCIELYTEHIPFEGISYFRVSKDVVNGLRPPRPVTKDGIVVSDPLWGLIEHCWSQQPKERPSAHFVEEKLRAIVESGASPGLQIQIATLGKEKEDLQAQISQNTKEIAQFRAMLSWHEQELKQAKELGEKQAIELANMSARIQDYTDGVDAISGLVDQLKLRRGGEHGKPVSGGKHK